MLHGSKTFGMKKITPEMQIECDLWSFEELPDYIFRWSWLSCGLMDSHATDKGREREMGEKDRRRRREPGRKLVGEQGDTGKETSRNRHKKRQETSQTKPHMLMPSTQSSGLRHNAVFLSRHDTG